MEITGPIRVGVVEPSPDGNYELHITFRDDFKTADLGVQGARFRTYIDELREALDGGALAGRDAQGALLIQQVCEQLAPHIDAGDIALGETLVVEVQRTPGVNLSDLLN